MTTTDEGVGSGRPGGGPPLESAPAQRSAAFPDRPATETGMSTGSVGSDAGHIDGPVGDAAQRHDLGDQGAVPGSAAWWRRPWVGVVGALLVLGAVAAAVLVLGRDPPVATVLGPGPQLPDVPTSAVVERWTLDLELRDQVAVSGDRVVVADDPFPEPSGDEQVLRAHHVRSRTVLWERRLPAGARFVLVDDWGQVSEAVSATISDPVVESAGVFGIAVADGRVLWERSSGFVEPANQGGDILLHRPEAGCERFDARSGATTMSSDQGGCAWIDDEQLAVHTGSGWQVYGPDGAATWSAPGVDAPPVVLDDLRIVARSDGELVARDTAGRVQWRRSTGTRDPIVRAVPGFGLVVGSWDDEDEEMRSRVYNRDGSPTTAGRGWQPAEALYLRQGERSFALTALPLGDRDRITVRELPSERVVARTEHSSLASLGATFTGRGLLTIGPDRTEVALRAWPDLVETWSVALPPGADTDDDVFPPVVQSSAAGMVVIVHDGDTTVLHAYS